MEKAFDRTRLKQFDVATKAMVNAHYELCLYQADAEVSTASGGLK